MNNDAESCRGGVAPPIAGLKPCGTHGEASLPEDLEDLWMYLKWFCQGKGRAMKQDALAKRLDTNDRDIRDRCARLREAGYPVASTVHPPYGVFVAITESEKQEFVEQLRSRIISLARGLRAFDKILTVEEIEKLRRGEVPAQLEMFS